MKVLLIYPNSEGYGRIPLALSILCACLKKEGHSVWLFDTTFMLSSNLDNEIREKLGIVKKIDTSHYWGKTEKIDAVRALLEIISTVNPDLIGITIIQNNYWTSVDLLAAIKKTRDTHIVAGGIFATAAAELLLNSKLVDSVIVGEGEDAFVELARKMESKKEFHSIKNLVYLKKGKLHRNVVRGYTDLNVVPVQDVSLFDDRHFWKAFDGKMFKTGYVELTRGCPFSCTYCANHFLNQTIYGRHKKHLRFKRAQYSIDEIRTLHSRYNFEFIFFADENMLALPFEELKRYAQLWKKYVRLPFFITSRVELVTKQKIKLLKEMGCATISFGIECGNEGFRKKILKRLTTNDQIIHAFALCREWGIRTTANNMFGFPYETEELIFETMKFNIQVKPDSFSLSIFAPYLGTPLYDLCVQEGFVKEGVPPRISMITSSILTMPQISRERIEELYFDFAKYVSGEIAMACN